MRTRGVPAALAAAALLTFTARLITHPAAQGSYLYTTGNCADINIKTNSASEVLACFYPTSGDPYCAERGYVDTNAGVWAVLATDVRDGTKFKLYFASRSVSTGVWAA